MKKLLSTLARGLLVFLAVLLVIALVGPYLIPLPAQAGRDATELAPADGRFVTVSGVRTFIREAGPADGTPVVLVHGFGGLTYTWRDTLPALAAAGYRALALDLKGFGLSDKSFAQDYSHASQADFVMDVMTAVGIERAVLVGHSMGGNVIAHAALRHPERVMALVFVAGAVREAGQPGGGSILGLPLSIGTLAEFPPFQRWGQLLLRYLLTRERLAQIQLSAYSVKEVVTPEVEDAYLGIVEIRDWDLALLGVLRDSGRNALPQPVGNLSVPTLILWGEQDTWVPLERGKALHAALPQSRLVVFPNVGHLPMEEAPAAFNAALIEFLDTVR
ncbi:MAG: alpha/beta hydrolase [Anaerolineales bacterium]|nr:alpha/beta hydrolase [Anaerolineales bacterium]